MWELLPKYPTAGTLQAIDDFRNASRRVGCDEQMNVVRHDFHSLDQHAVLLCCSVQDVLEPRLYVTHKDFATVLRAEHDVVRQIEDGSCVLDVTAILWLLNFHIIHLRYNYLFVKRVNALTCRLKSTVRRAVSYRSCWTVMHSVTHVSGSDPV
jgi:hypothetical protein